MKLFDAMVEKINNQTISILMRGQIPVPEAPQQPQQAAPAQQPAASQPAAPQRPAAPQGAAPQRIEVRQAAPERRQDMSKYREQRTELGDPHQQAAAAQDTREQPKREPIRVEQKIGRNDPCPCGSGKKYKNCHGRNL